MDEKKSGPPRPRRFAATPVLESLEGRRLMTATPSGIGIKETTANGVINLIVTGTNKADVIHVTDNGTNAAGNITLMFGNGQTYTSKTAIGNIDVLGKGGADQVTYDLTGTLVTPRSMIADLGAGNDVFTANVNNAVANSTGLDLEAYGGAGNDKLTINQAGLTGAGEVIPYLQGDAGDDTLTYNGTGTIGAGASLLPGLSGGAGNDTIHSSYAGIIAGNYIYNLTIDGGTGNDNITDDIHVLAGSPGTIGTDSSTPAVVVGGAGNDQVRFTIKVDPGASPAFINALALGDSGKDNVQHTSNIQSDVSNEKDTVLT